MREDKVPKKVGSMMQTIVSFRNAAEYQDELPSASESAVIRAGWVAILEWAERTGLS